MARSRYNPENIKRKDPLKHKILLDYVLSHADGDQRPYLRVSILNRCILALLDSGATRTVVGLSGFKILLNLGLTLNKRETDACTVANGQTCKSIGYISTRLIDKIVVLEILVIPDLPRELILGMDFWLAMDLVPDLKRDVWHFGSNPPVTEINSIKSDNKLSAEERLALDELLDRNFELLGTGVGVTNASEHEIITDSPPIKQRCYPVSPVRQGIINEEIRKMLADGIIEPSKSAWASPILLVPKKDAVGQRLTRWAYV